ncbi:MAG: M1 family metallopeptidase [Candidatus Zixiibacteriota bacterium]|nr:MAG: M1 family metallopeptidase [candidate division Zixibacteria bacterium]
MSAEGQAPRIASYRIDVRLDVEGKRLSGKEILTFVNTSRVSVDTLLLHLYPNAFGSDTTTLMRESLFPDRIKGKKKYRGQMKVERVGFMGGPDLTDKKMIDETIMKLPLPDPLHPQETVELEIEFVVDLPELFLRLGYLEKDFVIGQWFPKMAVLEEDGRWNAHQYHFIGEFFADFGTYDVSITLPLEYVVGATGYLVENRENADSTRTFVFRAEDVHDFAWAASPDYRVSKRVVDGINLNFFYKPEHEESVDGIMNCAEFALRFYGRAFGKYHYDHFTIMDAEVGLGGGAMEYPTLITISPSRVPEEKARVDAWIVFHEIAHQWWYGMVASNEAEEAWLDEGFAAFSQRRALEEKFKDEANLVSLWGLKLNDLTFARVGYLLDPQRDPMVKDSWKFRSYLSYRANVYSKASLALETLRNHLGRKKMDGLMREYFRRYKFRHPTTADFIRVVDEFAGEDLSSALEQLVFGTGVCDYEVASIESNPMEGEDAQERFSTTVVLRRLGEVILPVEVLIRLEDGEEIRQVWDGKERWTKIEINTASRIRAAMIDPEDRTALDINVNNNSLTARANDSVLMKLSAQSLFWLEILVDWMTCF